VAGLPAWAVLSAIIAIVRAGAALPIASVGMDPPWSVIAGVAAAIVIAGVGRRWAGSNGSWEAGPGRASAGSQGRPATARQPRPRRWPPLLGVAVAGAFVSLALTVSYQPDGSTRITVLDVGQGDAILVEGARGGRILLDSGPSPDALIVALDERLPPWDRRLDALVLTHPHEDHVAGAALLLERYRIGRVLEPGMRGPGPGAAAAREKIAARGVQHGTLATGDRITVDDLAFTVLWPDPGRVPQAPADTGTGINNVSIVLLGEVGGRRILLTGDIEEEIDPILVARGLPRLDFLKVAHHGSGTATTDRFLDATRPGLAVISAGTGNPYGHPAPATVGRLTTRDARVLRTDEAGSVEVAVDGVGRLTARAERTTFSRALAATPSQPVASGISTPVAASWPMSRAFACGIPQPVLAGAGGVTSG
jgi:competence protein ComEC